MSIPLIMLIAYVAITTLTGIVFSRRQKSAKHYFVAANSLSTMTVASLMFTECIAGAGTVGNAAQAYNSGISSVWANWGMTIGCVAFAFLALNYIRRIATEKGAMSLPEIFYHMFDSRCRLVMLAITVAVYIILYSNQATAAAAILAPLMGIDTMVVTWLITALFILIAITGGMKGIANMNRVHAVTLCIGMLIVALKAVSSLGGMSALQAAVPSTFFSLVQPNLQTVAGQGLGTAVGFIAAPIVVNACLSADSDKTAKRGIIVGSLLILPFALFTSIVGICASVALPDITPNSALYMMANSLGSVYGGLVSMAIIAAIWSSAPTLLLIICTTLTRDMYRCYIRPDADEHQQMMFSRVMAVIIGVIGTALGINAPSILNQMLGALQLRSVVGFVLIAAIYWKRVNSTAAFYSMLVGGTIAAVWHFAGNPFGWQPVWPASVLSLLLLIPIALLSKQPQKVIDSGSFVQESQITDTTE